MVGIGIVGLGYWGPNLLRNFSNIPGFRIAGVCDQDPSRLASIRFGADTALKTTDYRQIIDSRHVDAVAIATPVETHFEIAMKALDMGKHVLLEKPMTDSHDKAMRLADLAAAKGLVLMVDHTFCYMGAVRGIKRYVDDGTLGDIYYYDSTRINLGLFRKDVNVVWDLAVHDLAIIDFLFGRQPVSVSATGMAHFAGKQENTAYLTMNYPGNLIAHVNVSWLSPVKLRMTLIGGSKRMIVFDDLHPSEKIKLYDSGVEMPESREDVYKKMVEYRMGDVLIPTYERTEALRSELLHLQDCVSGKAVPLTDGAMGARVVRILECVSLSIRQFGKPVTL